MLSEEVIDKVVERLVNRIEQANEYVLKEIGNNIKEIGTIIPSKRKQLIQILKYGGDYDKIVKKISKITKKNVNEIYKMFDEIAKSDYTFAKQFYDYRNIKYIPYKKNEALRNQVRALANITAKDYLNLTKTSALGFGFTDEKGKMVFKGLKDTYYDLLDEAVLNVSQGKETFYGAIYQKLKKIGESGLKVVYPSGKTMRLDSAIRMNLKSGLTMMHMEMQQQLGKQFKADGIEISVHNNPAPDHEDAQGKQFSNKEFDKLQKNGVAKTYDGQTVNMHRSLKTTEAQWLSFRPIGTMNCYHYVFSIVLGINKQQYTNDQLKDIKEKNNEGFELDGKHYTNYEGTQLQRQLERKIREQKEQQMLAKSSGSQQLLNETNLKLNQLNKKYSQLSKVSGLPTKINRLRIATFDK